MSLSFSGIPNGLKVLIGSKRAQRRLLRGSRGLLCFGGSRGLLNGNMSGSA